MGRVQESLPGGEFAAIAAAGYSARFFLELSSLSSLSHSREKPFDDDHVKLDDTVIFRHDRQVSQTNQKKETRMKQAMVLYDFHGSPCARRVRIVLLEKGLEWETRMVDL